MPDRIHRIRKAVPGGMTLVRRRCSNPGLWSTAAARAPRSAIKSRETHDERYRLDHRPGHRSSLSQLTQVSESACIAYKPRREHNAPRYHLSIRPRLRFRPAYCGMQAHDQGWGGMAAYGYAPL